MNEIDIDTAYKTPIEEAESYPLLTKTFYGESKVIYWPQNESESFQNLQARTAQYPLIDRITNEKYMTQVKSFLQSPFEIRPLYIDEAGNNNIFDVSVLSVGRICIFVISLSFLTTIEPSFDWMAMRSLESFTITPSMVSEFVLTKT